jgi:hypothetical protein
VNRYIAAIMKSTIILTCRRCRWPAVQLDADGTCKSCCQRVSADFIPTLGDLREEGERINAAMRDIVSDALAEEQRLRARVGTLDSDAAEIQAVAHRASGLTRLEASFAAAELVLRSARACVGLARVVTTGDDGAMFVRCAEDRARAAVEFLLLGKRASAAAPNLTVIRGGKS